MQVSDLDTISADIQYQMTLLGGTKNLIGTSLIVIIYIYAFTKRFYPKRLTVHSGYTFFVSLCVFPGN